MTFSGRQILYAIGAAGVIAAAVYWSGIFNIAASSGHWAVTDWFLHTAMRRSVGFHATTEPPADFPSPAMIRRGAGHFETGCAPCHGSPISPRGAVTAEMTPPPPDLSHKIGEWEPKELFWIVKHGVKFTGMPAWPVQNRDDEVWSMAAFLKHLPGLDEAQYRRLAFGGRDAGGNPGVARSSPPADWRLDNCIRCHGADGKGDPNGAFPRLDIQTERYLLSALEAYASGKRSSGIMQAAVTGLDGSDLKDLAAHYASAAEGRQSSARPMPDPSSEHQRGRRIAEKGIPSEDIAACSGCHGNSNEAFPRLAGQYRTYLEIQLRLFSEETGRGGGRYYSLMDIAAHDLSDEDIRAVAHWYASEAAGVPDMRQR